MGIDVIIVVMLACPKMPRWCVFQIVACWWQAGKQKRGGIMKSKLMAIFFLVHSLYVEIVAKKGEICHRKLRYDQNSPQLLELAGA
jgi:hypothetical protein